MNKNPLVSVITTFLNAEKFIEESIQSVFAQTYANWEFLLIDDGSDDKSTDIAKTYAKQCPHKIYYLEHQDHKNKGISASRNLGIKNAKGKYIATLDADDIWMPKKLEEQVLILESNPEAAMVVGNTVYWYSWTGDPLDRERDYYVYDLNKPDTIKLNTLIKPPTFLNLILSDAVKSPTPSNILFRKNVAEDVGGFEEIFTGMHEDQAFLAKVFLKTPIYIASECWDFYRMHDHSFVSVAEKEGIILSAELFYIDWLEQYLTQNGYNDPELQKVLERRMWNYKHPNFLKLAGRARRLKRRLFKIINIISGSFLNLRH